MSKELGKRIAELRIKKGLGQLDLGEKIGMSTSTIGMWETGNRDPSSEMIVMLSDILGVSSDYLLKGEEISYESTLSQEVKDFITEVMNASKDQQKELMKYWEFMKVK